jgi:hypothetical protein
MQFGLQLNFQHPATENMGDRFQELLEQVRLAQAVGFHSIVAPQHYLPAPFQMLQPLPLLARMAAEAQQMRLIAGIMLLSLQNPIALAEDKGSRHGIAYLHAVSGAEISDVRLLGSVWGAPSGRHTRPPIRRVTRSAVYHRQPT